MIVVKRMVYDTIRSLTHRVPCVIIVGPNQIGKTTALQHTGRSSLAFTLANNWHYERIHKAPEAFLSRCYKPVTIDEAQRSPKLLASLSKLAKYASRTPGLVLASSCITPSLLTQVAEHSSSLAVVDLGGLLLSEVWRRPCSKLCDIIAHGDIKRLRHLKVTYTEEELLLSCLTGSYPEPVLNRLDRAFCSRWHLARLQAYVNEDINHLFPQIDRARFSHTIRALAKASGSTFHPESLDVSSNKTPLPEHLEHIALLEGTGMWRTVPDISVEDSPTTTLRSGWFRDSGLLCHVLRIRSESELRSHGHFAHIWRSFVCEELLKGFSDRLLQVRATSCWEKADGADLVLHTSSEKVAVAIEASQTTRTQKRVADALGDFVRAHTCGYGILMSMGRRVRKLGTGIFEIPAGCL
ncbi:MAG: DUF4143 domain-containing protein [Myxococcota bacterium]